MYKKRLNLAKVQSTFNRETMGYEQAYLLLQYVDLMSGNVVFFTYDFSSCFSPKLKIMHFQNRDIKLYTVVLLFLCFLKFLTKLCCC